MGNHGSSRPKEEASSTSSTPSPNGIPRRFRRYSERTVYNKIPNVGDVVRCPDFHILKMANPIQQDHFLHKIAYNRCVVVAKCPITYTLTLMYDRKGEANAAMANVSEISCIVEKEATVAPIGDGALVRIGSFVEVHKDASPETGRTGVVTYTFVEDKMIQVQFANGRIINYPAKVLVSSSQTKVETMDLCDNWIGVNSPVRITKSEARLECFQKASNLPFDSSYMALAGKIATVSSIVLVPYVPDKDVAVISRGKLYTLNLKALLKVVETEDSTGEKIQVGDSVGILEDPRIKNLQTPEFGGWNDSVRKKQGKVGKIEELNVCTMQPVTSIRIKVRYSDGEVLLLNPKVLTKVSALVKDEISDEESSLGPPPTRPRRTRHRSSPAVGNEIELQLVPRRNQANLTVKGGLTFIPKNSLSIHLVLGVGNFGHVYSGMWAKETYVKSCAIKVLSEEHDKHAAFREAKIQASIKHPNIVELYGINVEEDSVWLVMRLVDGVDLYDRLWKAPESLSIPSLLRMAKQLVSATSYLHEKGYLHGDIKSSNVLVENTTRNAFMCDFGSSTFLGARNETEIAYTMCRRGTLFYLAPECMEMNIEGMYQKPSFKSDVWSLGALFLEMFASKELDQVYNSLNAYKATGNSASLQVHWSNLPEEIRDIILVSLRMNPEDRPSATQIHISLQRK